MRRFIPHLGILAGLTTGAFLMFFFSYADAPSVSSDGAVSQASATPIQIPVAEAATSSVPTPPEQQTAATQAKKVASEIPAVPAPVPITLVAPAVVPTQPDFPLPSSENASLDASASSLRAALVNIICMAPAGSSLRSMSGSGVFIDSKGVILTNAHVAQYFLLADRGVSCVIRAGSPAVEKYDAALIYISPEWLRANPRVLTESLPNGTGEYDFALLAVTKSATTAALPLTFPSVSLASNPPVADTPVAIASYGAQFLASSQVQSALFPTIVFGSIRGVLTFARNTTDVLALGGSAAAQEGSSGGGVADASGALVGTITTSTVTGATETRALNAITASYIRSQYATETGQALDLLLAQSPSDSIKEFSSRLRALESIITAHLP